MTDPAAKQTDWLGDEIDLREYVQMFLRRWPWIVVPTLIAALVAAGISFFVLSPVYQATALVAVTPPKYLMQFSPEFRTVEQERIQTLIYSTLPELARSDELVQQVLDSLQGGGDQSTMTLASLRDQMEVEGSKDLGLIYLRVQDTNRGRAAEIANIWTDLYVQALNDLYGTQGTDYEFFVDQLDQAKGDVLTAQGALAEFKARDPSTLLSSELAAQTSALNDYLVWQNKIEVRLQEVDGWLAQLAALPTSDTVPPSDEVAAFLMQLEVLDLGQGGGQSQLQIPLEQLAEGRTVAAQIAFLQSLRSMLEAHLAVIDTKAAEIEPEILRLQEGIQEANNERDRLDQDLKLARSLQESLALKAEEARISLESQEGVARSASSAAVPENPIGPRKLVNTALGAALGLAVGLALVVLLELVRTPAPGESEGKAA
jgi:succinoglycan biosynthesis transport protein ExoP